MDGVSIGVTTTYTFNNVTADHTITATFTQSAVMTYTLTVNTVGQGTVDRKPQGSVLLPASAVYEAGTAVTLTAMADADWQFAGWSGAVSGVILQTTVTLDANKIVTATFREAPRPITVTITPEVSHTFAFTGSTGLSIDVDIPAGAVTQTIDLVCQAILTVTTSPTGYQFANIAFQMAAVGQKGFKFVNPITVTIPYQAEDIAGLDADTLVLRYFNAAASTWAADGITLVVRDTAKRRLIFTIAHLTDFAVFGQPEGATTPTVYLPLVIRGG